MSLPSAPWLVVIGLLVCASVLLIADLYRHQRNLVAARQGWQDAAERLATESVATAQAESLADDLARALLLVSGASITCALCKAQGVAGRRLEHAPTCQVELPLTKWMRLHGMIEKSRSPVVDASDFDIPTQER